MYNIKKIERIFEKTTHSKQIHEAILFIENTKGDFSVNYGFGGKEIHSPLFMASVTKLYITACILILQEQNKVSLDNFIKNFLDKKTLDGLHIFNGIDYSQKLTISDLLFQTSGLPDGLEEGGIVKEIVRNDNKIFFEVVLEKTKKIRPKFAPNSVKKAYYSDMNFRLLGNIIENVAEISLEEAFHRYICILLGLKNTYLPKNKDDFIPNIYYKNNSLYRQKYMISGYNYDSITTAKELMLFLKAFWGGLLFSKNIFEKLSAYKKLQMTMGLGLINYGGGYMQIPLNSIFTLFRGKGKLLGHSGATGSFAFYYPYKDLYFVGDTNQMANPGLPIQMAMRLAMSI